MKLKEIYKITFSGLYATATLKAEIEPHPHLVKLDQVGKDISNFSGYWYFHVWVEAKSKKTAIRKGAVQIMNYLETEGCKVIAAVTLGTMETLLEQKAAWEVLKAEEEEEDTVSSEAEIESEAENEAEPDGANSEHCVDKVSEKEENSVKAVEGYSVALKHKKAMDEGSPRPTPFMVGDYEMADWALVECKPCYSVPTDYKEQVKFDPKKSVIRVYIMAKETDSLPRSTTTLILHSKMRRLALAKIKRVMFDNLKTMAARLGSVGDDMSYDPFEFNLSDMVRVISPEAQYTTYYSQFGLMATVAYNSSPSYDGSLTQKEVRKAKEYIYEVIARETIWEPVLTRFSNVYLIQNTETKTLCMIQENGLERA